MQIGKIKIKAPLADRIVIRRDVEADKTASGIIIPEGAKDRQHTGFVVAVGPGRTLDNGAFQATTLQVGDHVMFGKYSGTELKTEEGEYLVLREQEIQLLLE